MTSEPGSYFSSPSNNNDNNIYQPRHFILQRTNFYLIIHLRPLRDQGRRALLFSLYRWKRGLVGLGEIGKGKNVNQGWIEEGRLFFFKFFFFSFFKIVLKHGWFTVLWYFLLYHILIQPHMYTHPFFFRFFSRLDDHRILGRVLCAV